MLDLKYLHTKLEQRLPALSSLGNVTTDRIAELHTQDSAWATCCNSTLLPDVLLPFSNCSTGYSFLNLFIAFSFAAKFDAVQN